jgi:hypothetical protein
MQVDAEEDTGASSNHQPDSSSHSQLVDDALATSTNDSGEAAANDSDTTVDEDEVQSDKTMAVEADGKKKQKRKPKRRVDFTDFKAYIFKG